MNDPFALLIAIARRILFGVTLLVVIRILSMPPAKSASASLTFAVQTPMEPDASCSFAIAGHLCVLACGRLATRVSASFFRIVARFCSSLSRSTQSTGVSSSHFDTPTSEALASFTHISADVYPLALVGIHMVMPPAPAVFMKLRHERGVSFLRALLARAVLYGFR